MDAYMNNYFNNTMLPTPSLCNNQTTLPVAANFCPQIPNALPSVSYESNQQLFSYGQSQLQPMQYGAAIPSNGFYDSATFLSNAVPMLPPVQQQCCPYQQTSAPLYVNNCCPYQLNSQQQSNLYGSQLCGLQSPYMMTIPQTNNTIMQPLSYYTPNVQNPYIGSNTCLTSGYQSTEDIPNNCCIISPNNAPKTEITQNNDCATPVAKEIKPVPLFDSCEKAALDKRISDSNKVDENIIATSAALRNKIYRMNILFKTVMCRDYEVSGNGECPRGEHCQFAHGKGDMRDPRSHPLYRSKLCTEINLDTGKCPRGILCYHAHTKEELMEHRRYLINNRNNQAYIEEKNRWLALSDFNEGTVDIMRTMGFPPVVADKLKCNIRASGLRNVNVNTGNQQQ